MINLDTRLINQLTGDELSVFIHILKRIGKQNKCFPSRYTLQKETSYGRRRIADAINGLKDKEIIEVIQENKNGNFGKTIYRIKTDLAGVFITAKNEEIEEKPSELGTFNRDTGNRTTVNRTTVNRTTVNGQLSINNIKYYQDQEINNIKCVENQKNTHKNFENFKEDILNRFPDYKNFDLDYYFKRVNIYLQANPKQINDFSAYAVSFMIGDLKTNSEVKKKESSDITVLGCDRSLDPEQRKNHFKELLYNEFKSRFKLSDLEAFYNEFSKVDINGILIIEKSVKGLNTTLIDSFIKSLKPA